MWNSAAVQLETDLVPRQRSTELSAPGTTPELLRALATCSDATSSESIRLDQVWAELVLGHCSVADTFFAARRSFLLTREPRERITRKRAGALRRLRRRQLDLLEPVLLGRTQKAIAIEFGISVSTISTCLRDALFTLGISCPASKVPPIVVALVSAARCSTGAVGRVSQITDGTVTYRVVSIERPDLALSNVLTPAEFVSVRLLVEGKHHEEIAGERNASPRTIANQLGSAFRKLGVSGRAELLAALARGSLPAVPRLKSVPRARRTTPFAVPLPAEHP
jgi:DNA-binding CsgD family transcriptional regulator